MPLHFDKPVRATLTSVNPQSENHGPDELVPSLHLRFAMDAPASVLADYDPDLPAYLFNGPAPRFSKLAQPLKWDEECTGARLTIDYGIDGEDNPETLECRVHRHVITVRQGPAVTLEFTCSCVDKQLSEAVVGRLGMLVKHALWIALTPGKPSEKGPVAGDGNPAQGALSLVT